MLRSSFAGFVVVAVLAGGLTVAARADDGGDYDEIQGVEQLHQQIVLTPTTNAPAGATGEAEFDAECAFRTNSAILLVKTEGLSDGTYTVTVTDLTGTNNFTLGTFDVSARTNDDDEGGDVGRTNCWGGGTWTNETDFGSWTNWPGCDGFTNHFDSGVWTNWVGSWTNWISDCTFTNWHDHFHGDTNQVGRGAFPLPAGLEPLDVAGISVADSNGVVDLVGDFTSLTNTLTGEFDAECAVSPGLGAPGAQGQAMITVTMKHGRAHGKFLLTATGLPARKKMTVLVNGVINGIARSDKRGDLTIRHLRLKNLTAVKSVIATDAQDNVVLSVSF